MKEIKKKIRIGTRGSLLAEAQTHAVTAQLIRAGMTPEQLETVVVKSLGDLAPDQDLIKLDAKGVFVKELEEALLENRIDLAVHSLKDLQTELAPGLMIGAVLARVQGEDVLCSLSSYTLESLPIGSCIGTGSLRRRSQLLSLREDLKILPIRGNVDSRLGKLKAGEFDAIILSHAGLERLGIDSVGISPLPTIPAVGQGGIAIEVREESELISLLNEMNDIRADFQARVERVALKALQGGCLAPIGIHCALKDNEFHLRGFVGSLDGRRVAKAEMKGGIDVDIPHEIGEEFGRMLIAQGAREILDEVRRELMQKRLA